MNKDAENRNCFHLKSFIKNAKLRESKVPNHQRQAQDAFIAFHNLMNTLLANPPIVCISGWREERKRGSAEIVPFLVWACAAVAWSYRQSYHPNLYRYFLFLCRLELAFITENATYWFLAGKFVISSHVKAYDLYFYMKIPFLRNREKLAFYHKCNYYIVILYSVWLNTAAFILL